MKIKPDIYDETKVFFNLFRRELAIAAGVITKDKYFGTPDDGIDWKLLSTMTDFYGYWSAVPKDPIWYLLAHSDRDGFITCQHTALLIPRLKEISKKLTGSEVYPNWQKVTKDFSTKLQKACDEGIDITFE